MGANVSGLVLQAVEGFAADWAFVGSRHVLSWLVLRLTSGGFLYCSRHETHWLRGHIVVEIGSSDGCVNGDRRACVCERDDWAGFRRVRRVGRKGV
jgi:hypothetical protein